MQPIRDVLTHGEMRKQRSRLVNEANAAILRWHLSMPRRHLTIAYRHRAFIGFLEPGDNPEEGRLTRAAWSKEGADLSGLDVERDSIEHGSGTPRISLAHGFQSQ